MKRYDEKDESQAEEVFWTAGMKVIDGTCIAIIQITTLQGL